MVIRVTRQRVPGLCRWVACAVTLVGLGPASLAEYNDVNDIKPFGVLGIDGSFRVGYVLDSRDRNTYSSGGYEERLTWEEEFSVLSRSFVYHPGFLSIDLGGGPIFVQQQFESEVGEEQSDETLLNVFARLNFLELKNYPFSIYYERSHPSITTSLSGRFLTEFDVYGLRGRIYDLLGSSTTIKYGLESKTTEGGELGWVVDDVTDTASVLISSSFRTKDRLELKYDQFDTQSASGSPGLPIYSSSIFQEVSEARLRNYFGRDDRVEVFQVLRRLRQDTETVNANTLDDRHYTSDARIRLSDKARSYFRYSSYDTEQSLFKTSSRDFEVGFVRQTGENLDLEAIASIESAEQVNFSRDLTAVRASFTYSRDLGFGSLGISGHTRARRTDQESSDNEIPVFDELHILVGTNPADLANGFVISGSIIVSNASRTQTFVEGLDFRLIDVGSTTRIQRLIGGNINDGETVLVDYTYESSGTAEFDTNGSGFSVDVGFLGAFDAFARIETQDTRIRSGFLSNPTNDYDNIEFGLSARNQFLDGWSLSAQYRHRDQREEIAPFVSDSLDLNLTTSLRGSWRTTIAGSFSRVEFDSSEEDIDQVSYRVSLSGRLFERTIVSYDAVYLSDDGGSLERSQLQHRLGLQWAYRKVRVVLRALYSDDELGQTNRNTKLLTIQLTRNF